MNVYTITVPIYAESELEAMEAQQALFDFVNRYRKKNVAVTGNKVAAALKNLEGNPFIKSQVDKFLTR